MITRRKNATLLINVTNKQHPTKKKNYYKPRNHYRNQAWPSHTMPNNNPTLKALQERLISLPENTQAFMIDKLDPARTISTLEFRSLIETHSPHQFKSIKKVAVVSGGKNEPELYFLNPEAEINCLQYEQDNSKWDLMKDWNTEEYKDCLLYTSPSPRDLSTSRMPSSA